MRRGHRVHVVGVAAGRLAAVEHLAVPAGDALLGQAGARRDRALRVIVSRRRAATASSDSAAWASTGEAIILEHAVGKMEAGAGLEAGEGRGIAMGRRRDGRRTHGGADNTRALQRSTGSRPARRRSLQGHDTYSCSGVRQAHAGSGTYRRR